MTSVPQNAGSYTVKNGETVFFEGRDVKTLNLLLQGKLKVLISPARSLASDDEILRKSYRIFDIEQNIFIGANDIFSGGRHALTCRAGADCSLFGYDVKTPAQAVSLVNTQKDYGAYILNSLCYLIDNSNSAYKKLSVLRDSLKTASENMAMVFWVLKGKYGFEYSPDNAFFADGAEALKALKESETAIPPVFSQRFIEENHGAFAAGASVDQTVPEDPRIEYYSRMYSLPVELRKSFFGADMYITSYHATDASTCLAGILHLVREAFRGTDEYVKRLCGEDSKSIFAVYLKAAGEIGAAGFDVSPALAAMDYIVSKMKAIAAVYESEYEHALSIDLAYLEYTYNNIKSGSDSEAGGDNPATGTGASRENIPEELKDSAKKIMEFSGLPEERTDMFLMNLAAFRNLRDRLSADEAAKNIRSEISHVYFEIYEAVFRKALATNDNSRLINMFLNFGYMDERLLTTDQVLSLYRLAGKEQPSGAGPAHNMREWLTAIYKIKRDPSINEFGQDYLDVFREMKKFGKATEKDRPAYEGNRDARLSYEIANMFKTNHKLCQGQISLYFPILHKDGITRDLFRTYVSKEAISAALNNILEVDFSVFHREVHFKDADAGIEKELVMKQFIPDIILIPVYGSRAMMWQEISGRNRSTPGRFLLPAFTDENLDDMVLKLVGNFRWELCRTMMGSAWNDVTQPSLTSEYTDYIQFYKKNGDLSNEAKEKLKAQIQKYHNRTREIFTADYELWINNESKGNVRLNKIVRNIFYRHCPMSREIREQLGKQPMYFDIANLFRNQRAKFARDLENRYGKYAKNGPLDPDLEHNLVFYRDL